MKIRLSGTLTVLYTVTAVWIVGTATGTFAALDVLARNERLANALIEPELEYRRLSGRYYEYKQHFVDAEERLILDELPKADYSAGSVVFVGSSNMKTGMLAWTLPQEQRRLVHNYGIGATNHTFCDQFVRYLVEEQGLLGAGPDKTLLVFGLSYHTVAHPVADGFFSNLWHRHGLYNYSFSQGIVPREMTALERFLRTEKVRISRFLWHLPTYFKQLYVYGSAPAPESIEQGRHDGGKSSWAERWKTRMSSNWRQRISSQLEEFSHTVGYLRENGARVAVILLPLGSWEGKLPFAEPYSQHLTKICHYREVPLYDFRDLLDDKDFADAVHPNLDGMEKLHQSLMPIALSHLFEVGVLSE